MLVEIKGGKNLTEGDVERLHKMHSTIKASKRLGVSFKNTADEIIKYWERNNFISTAQFKFVERQYYRAITPDTLLRKCSGRGCGRRFSYMDGLDRDELADGFGMYQF